MDIFIGVDVGGTFTDFAVSIPGERRVVFYKQPSTPSEPDRAIVEGLTTLLRAENLNPAAVRLLAHGTTVGTNALIERRCGRIGLVTSAGFRDLLEIGRQTRPKMYDIHLDNPEPLVPRRLRFEVPERRLADGRVHQSLDEEALSEVARHLAAEEVDAVVVFFLHSYRYPEHEQRAATLLAEHLPERVRIVTSAEVFPEFREYERLSTALLNAALTTVMDVYLARFSAAVGELGISAPPRISQSAGGLMSVEMARRLPISASLSGPAAGVVGAARRGQVAGFRDLITLDVGGTSTDVSLLRDGPPGIARDRSLAGFPLRIPLLDVNAVGAGGGSVAWVDRDGLMKVGPRSAGAQPGPACYGAGGEEATLTDANVCLGRLNPVTLLEGRMPIQADLARAAVAKLAREIELDVIETARGIVQVASANIVKAIRTVSVERGYDPAEFALFAYGGAGPLHAVEVARELGMRRIIIPPNPGILCAEGLLSSDLRMDFVKTTLVPVGPGAGPAISAARNGVMDSAREWFAAENIASPQQVLLWSADMRYRRQNYEISIPLENAWFSPFDATSEAKLLAVFHDAHDQVYGFASKSEPVEVVSIKVQALGRLEKPDIPTLHPAHGNGGRDGGSRANGNGRHGQPDGSRAVCFQSAEWHDTPVYARSRLEAGQRVEGPAVIEQMDSTTVLFPGDVGVVDPWANLVVELGKWEALGRC